MRYLASVCALLLTINTVYAQDAAVSVEDKNVPVRESAGSLLKKVGNYLDSIAEEMAESENIGNEENQTQFNAFGLPENVVGVVNNAEKNSEDATGMSFPNCDDERLLAETRRLMDEKQSQVATENIYQYRRQQLVAKNMEHFVSVDASEFKPHDNYEVADRIITLKINKGIPADAFRICRGSNSIIGREVFLLMYPQNDKVLVEVLNYTPSAPLRFTVQ